MSLEARERVISDRGVRNADCSQADLEVVSGSDGSGPELVRVGGSDESQVAEGGKDSTGEERSPFCAFVREDGGKCRAMARRPSEFCFWHDPAEMAARQSARAVVACEPPVFEPCDLKTGADVYGLLERAAVYAAMAAHPDLKRVQTINVLASTLLRAIHVRDLEEEVARLRAYEVETQGSVQRLSDQVEAQRKEKWQAQDDSKKWLKERNKLRSYLRSIGTDPDSLPKKWMVDGRSIFEHPPPEAGVL